MAELKVMVESLGLEGVRSLLQSGNLIFEAGNRKPADLEELLARETGRRLKLQTEYFVRDADALTKIIQDNPFAREAKADPGHLVVFFLKQRPSAESVRKLQAQIKGPEVVEPGALHVYVTYPAGQGRSKLTNTAIEKALESRGTARNWNTILKMHAAML